MPTHVNAAKPLSGQHLGVHVLLLAILMSPGKSIATSVTCPVDLLGIYPSREDG